MDVSKDVSCCTLQSEVVDEADPPSLGFTFPWEGTFMSVTPKASLHHSTRITGEFGKGSVSDGLVLSSPCSICGSSACDDPG